MTHPTAGVTIDPGPPMSRWAVTDLVLPGLRRNPRRAHLWVSTVLGKHIPVAPSRIIGAAEDLADLISRALDPDGLDPHPDRSVRQVGVFGFAETATGLGHCVARRLHAEIYLHSTRRAVPALPTVARFQEGHSHATDHLVVPTSRDIAETAGTWVLVDDEISTGVTALAAVDALRGTLRARRWVVASLVDLRTEADRRRCDDRARAMGVDLTFVALAGGSAVVPDDLVARVAALDPAVESTPHSASVAGEATVLRQPWPAHVPDGGRHGVLHGDGPAFEAGVAEAARSLGTVLDPQQPVVVIGHEEFMYLPLRIAAALETDGWSVTSQTTTRSPAVVTTESGYPLRNGVEFTAPEPDSAGGRHGTRHLYNAAADDASTQRVLVIDPAADTPALAAPGGVVDVLTRSGRDLVVLVAGGTSFDALARSRAIAAGGHR
ncbi:phosphoribosyltransferase family protein [Williamsia deligens]|uniref:Phosphoribosyltransferase family protein n=1 Tax=Williamsia deligens TaxID=321325 RepID=A0ABW3GAE9_9NOCA|nr:phosphoribosyltransferase family protein [Williamsia deligens]MCP2195180.1 TRSP domain C terminus to PRTase_2 [Williamsia deligens]